MCVTILLFDNPKRITLIVFSKLAYNISFIFTQGESREDREGRENRNFLSIIILIKSYVDLLLSAQPKLLVVPS